MTYNTSTRDWYADLGLEPGVTLAEVKSAFHRLAKEHHPDKQGPEFTGDASEFRKAREAYEKLSDVNFRKHYDEKLSKAKSKNPYDGTFADPSPFNLFTSFNPRRPLSPQPQTNADRSRFARYEYTATEFTEQQPEFKDMDPLAFQKTCSLTKPRHDYAAQTGNRSHGLKVRVENHLATSKRGCPLKAADWTKLAGTNLCIFCYVFWEGTSQCPGCTAVACQSCGDLIQRGSTNDAEEWNVGD